MKTPGIGKCHICSEIRKLTFEHVPPKKAFNNYPVLFTAGWDAISSERPPWDTTGKRIRKSQAGMGSYTLCSKCNNDRTEPFARSFIEYAHQAYSQLKHSTVKPGDLVKLRFRDVYPLRIIKEVLAMFCSINSAEFIENNGDIKRLLMSREETGLSPQKYSITSYVLVGSAGRYVGNAALVNFFTSEVRFLSEVAAPPFGYVLEIDPKVSNDLRSLAVFANQYGYKDKTDLTIEFPVRECHSPLPLDFRSKEAIARCYGESQDDFANT